MQCPLCVQSDIRSSWVGTVRYRGTPYTYVECAACGTQFCNPMPDGEAVEAMYGPGYATACAGDPAIVDPKEPGRALDWLRRLEPGTFLDFGCGEGKLLEAVSQLGWQAVGVEYDPEVARSVQERTGVPVVSYTLGKSSEIDSVADVLHLGDVIEHLTDVNGQLPHILKILKPNGILLAQGPLEAGPTLFSFVLGQSRRARGAPPIDAAPYHVMLATVPGQRRLFQRLELEELEYSVREVAWPAPDRLRMTDLGRPRAAFLFSLRRVSQACSAMAPSRWGNRYFYAGRKPV